MSNVRNYSSHETREARIGSITAGFEQLQTLNVEAGLLEERISENVTSLLGA